MQDVNCKPILCLTPVFCYRIWVELMRCSCCLSHHGTTETILRIGRKHIKNPQVVSFTVPWGICLPLTRAPFRLVLCCLSLLSPFPVAFIFWDVMLPAYIMSDLSTPIISFVFFYKTLRRIIDFCAVLLQTPVLEAQKRFEPQSYRPIYC